MDVGALERWRERLSQSSQPIWLHTEVGRRMGERLALIKRPAQTALIWEAAGGLGDEIIQTWPQTRRIRVKHGTELGIGAPPQDAGWARRGWDAVRRMMRGSSDLTPLPSRDVAQLPAACADLLWSNMGLHLQPDPLATFQAWHRALAVDGFVMFSTLGPGSLPELRSVYQRQGWGVAMAPLVDMHDLGDMMVQAGWADPVVDQETLTLTWNSAADALAELRGLGGNAAPDRFAGLRTPRWRQRLEAALRAQAQSQPQSQSQSRPDTRVALTFEIIYGHAYKPLPKVRMAAHTAVSAEDLRTLARSARSRSGSAP